MLLQIDKEFQTLTRIKSSKLNSFGLDERRLQALLFENLELLLPETEFIKIMQSKQGGEHPDILALDVEGTLYIFELKIWESHYENLLQVLRYGQLYGTYNYSQLNELFEENNPTGVSLEKKYAEVFNGGDTNQPFPNETLNKKQVFIVITNGIDNKTRDGIRYWQSLGLDVRAWPYQVYEGHPEGKILGIANNLRASGQKAA